MNNIGNISAIPSAKKLNPRVKMFKDLKYFTQHYTQSVFKSIKDDYKLSRIIDKEYLCETEYDLFNWDIEYNMSNDSSLMNLLEWGESLLTYYTDKIHRFISLKQRYEKLFFRKIFLKHIKLSYK